MATIQFQCSACAQTLLVGADTGGQKAVCPRCGTLLSVPVTAVVEAGELVPVRGPPQELPLLARAVDEPPVTLPPDDDDYSEPRRGRLRKKGRSKADKVWVPTRVGLLVLAISL